jgi:hypothetical protein
VPTQIFTTLHSGLETTRGTLHAPTRVLEFMNDVAWNQGKQSIRPQEQRGSYFGYYRAGAGIETNTVSIAGNASFNQVAFLGEMFIKGSVTATTVGTTGKQYAFIPSSATDDLQSSSFEWGYDTAPSAGTPAFQLPYVVGDNLELTFDKSNVEGVTFKADFLSPKAVTNISAYTAGSATIASTAISPINTVVSIDPTTIGTTVDNNITKCTFLLNNTWTNLQTLNNTAAAQATFRATVRDWTFTAERYYADSNERLRYIDKAPRKIRILNTSPVVIGAGPAVYTLTLDLYGILDVVAGPASVGGLMMDTLTYKPIYDATATTDFSLTVITAEATIT